MPGSGHSLGTRAAFSYELGGWDCRMGKNTKLNLTKLLSFNEGSSLRDKGICNAKQSSSSQKRTVTRRGLGGSKSSPHPPARHRVPGGPDLPGRQGVPGNLWLARALNHMTA